MLNSNEPIRPGKETLMSMAKAMAAGSDGVLRLARNEADATTARDPEAATFLKLNGRRLGRDLEVYAFMAEINGGWEPVLPDLAAELVLQVRREAPDAYAVGAETLVSMGRSIYTADQQEQWADIFAEPAGPRP